MSMHRLDDEPRAKTLENWVNRVRAYLSSRTADHWLMFIAGIVVGAILT